MTKELKLGTGSLTLEQVNLILKALPLELSFVDKDQIIQYYNESASEKLFLRTPNAIGRRFLLAHPPRLQAVVEQLFKDLETGVKDRQTMWFQKKEDTMVHITFVAVRDEAGEFLGVLEYIQDITEITKLEGDNRNVNA